MTGTKEDSNSSIGNAHIGGYLSHRALSLSSVASSSIAPTSIVGDLSSLSDDSNEEQLRGSPTKRNQIDRYGFTGGNQYTDPSDLILSMEKIRMREQKWLAMLNNWDRWMSRHFAQVKNRCRKGIPPSLRGRAWQHLSGGKVLHQQNPGQYEKYLAMEADANCVEDIEKDLHRQFPFHEMFVERGGSGQQDLRDVLRALSVYNPKDGYCQGQAPIAAVLLMHMPAEEAFWCFVAMCGDYLQGYFSPGLEAIQVDGYVMQSLLRKVSPVAHKHLEKNHVTPVLYMTEWFMCVFSRTLPWTSVLRLWDMFFCEGIKVVFRCALVLMRSTLGMVEKVKALPGLYETMEALRKIDPSYMKEDRLVFEIVNLKISERDLEHELKLQKIKWKKNKDSGPQLLVATDKDASRCYRYTPAYRLADSATRKNRTRGTKNVNAISVNSSAILQQANEIKSHEKRRHREKKKAIVVEEGTLALGNNATSNEGQAEVSLSTSLRPKQAGNEQNSQSEDSAVTMASSKNSSPPWTNSKQGDVRTPSNGNGGFESPECYVNQRDELTVF